MAPYQVCVRCCIWTSVNCCALVWPCCDDTAAGCQERDNDEVKGLSHMIGVVLMTLRSFRTMASIVIVVWL